MGVRRAESVRRWWKFEVRREVRRPDGRLALVFRLRPWVFDLLVQVGVTTDPCTEITEAAGGLESVKRSGNPFNQLLNGSECRVQWSKWARSSEPLYYIADDEFFLAPLPGS